MPHSSPPRIGVLADPDLPERVREAGGEPVPLALPPALPRGGVALAREWVADVAEISCSSKKLDGLLLSAGDAESLAGLLTAALRLDLPAVVAPPATRTHFGAAPYALGLAPLREDPAATAVAVAREGGPRVTQLIESFSLANALRAACALGGGQEALVHLAALALEAGAADFAHMTRVLAPETPLTTTPDAPWYTEHGPGGLLALLGESLNDTRSVEGWLRETLPPAPPAPPPQDGSRLVLVEGRASGTQAPCRVPGSMAEIAGECRVHRSEKAAVGAIEEGSVEPGSLLVVCGCGPRGGPGLLRLDRLAQALREKDLEGSVAVFTDGLAPADVRGAWLSPVSPEAASGGVIGLLRDGDRLRIDLEEGRILTSIRAGELERRDPHGPPAPAATAYAARYVRSALPALEGAGFD